MRKKTICAAVAAMLCLFLLAGCQLPPCNCGCPCADTYKKQRFAAAEVSGITITTLGEDVRIYYADGPDIVVTYSAMQPLAVLEDGELRIDTREESSRATISVYLPRGDYSTISICTVEGSIEIGDVETVQEIYAYSDTGDIYLDRAKGLLDAATGRREITVGPGQTFVPEPVEGGGYRVHTQVGSAQTRIELYTEESWMGLY